MPQPAKAVSRQARRAARAQKREGRSARQSTPTFEDRFTKPPVKAKREPLVALTDRQADYDDEITDSRVIFGVGPAGTGKAQPLDSLVKIPGGWSRMGDIHPGMKVTSADGTDTEVLSVHPQGEKDIFRITFEDGRSAECCAEHLWRVYRHDWQPAETRYRVINLAEIQRLLELPSARKRLYVDLPQPEQVADVELPVDPYLLGALLGDGHSADTRVIISTADDFILDQVARALPKGMRISPRGRYDYDLVRSDLYLPRNPLMAAIKDLGLARKCSSDKFIPEIYRTASPKQRLALLQGLMDTDGTVCKTGSVSFCTVSEELALHVQEIVRSLGGLASIRTKQTSYTHNGEKMNGKTAFVVRIRVANPRSVFRLPRKVEKLSETYQYADSLRLRIVSIEPVGRKEAQCISVAHGSHLYVTNDYIVTHNTYFATRRAAEALEKGEIAKIYLTRPAVEAGESLGFLPGELDEKYEPYLRPFKDALHDHFGQSHTDYLIKSKIIEPVPLGFLRGSTITGAWMLADEMQNATKSQMKMLLTRIGKDSKFIINGDPRQVDIRPEDSGLMDAVRRLSGKDEFGTVTFTHGDVVRDDLVAAVLRAYDD